MLKGKQGRFRQNLLGKRVDYSGRSVIVVGPELRLHQCGLPKQMALELFKPFVMKRLVDQALAQNIKSAKRMVERARPQVWDVLEEVIREHPVMLNRAPTLHRLGIQAFEPVLVEGKAIKIHPLVCAAFNADFDGDQMAVHVPLSAEAQAEARILMLSTNNILSPAHGRPIATPTQDMVLGLYYLTLGEERADRRTRTSRRSARWPRRCWRSTAGTRCTTRSASAWRTRRCPSDLLSRGLGPDDASGRAPVIRTTIGRVIFNEAFPDDFEYRNQQVLKADIGAPRRRGRAPTTTARTVEQILDNLKNLGFHYATRAGVTIGVEDVTAPESKAEDPGRAREARAEGREQYRKGIITDDERRQELIEIWTAGHRRGEGGHGGRSSPPTNPIFMMANSGARGNIMQIRQLAGMRGLVANPKGEIIPRPIKSNFREGLSVLEYFISTHGARKGLADTALRTADSGYLTRRLVDVAQELIIREEDCGTDRSIPIVVNVDQARRHRRQERARRHLAVRPRAGRGREGRQQEGGAHGRGARRRALSASWSSPASSRSRCVRSSTCEAEVGVCAMCYGRSLASGRMVDIGEAVGIIAAQSIGEPGTQLTMRTFHTGGVAGEDITHGLPRVRRAVRGAQAQGRGADHRAVRNVSIEDDDEKHVRRITVTDDDRRHGRVPGLVPGAAHRVDDGDMVEVGQQLTEGSVNPHEKLRVEGVLALQQHLVDEVQQVYRSQGVTIHDKHIELIARQMLRKVHIIEPGDTEFLPGDMVARRVFEETERRGRRERRRRRPRARPVLLGITKASLATDSWLSAASFQETTRVLTDAAISAKSDPLLGLKENVIIGKLIPAGTGMPRYRNVAGQDQARGHPRVLAGASARAGRRGRRVALRRAGPRGPHPRAGRADARRVAPAVSTDGEVRALGNAHGAPGPSRRGIENAPSR